jgi:hypothetical protein
MDGGRFCCKCARVRHAQAYSRPPRAPDSIRQRTRVRRSLFLFHPQKKERTNEAVENYSASAESYGFFRQQFFPRSTDRPTNQPTNASSKRAAFVRRLRDLIFFYLASPTYSLRGQSRREDTHGFILSHYELLSPYLDLIHCS